MQIEGKVAFVTGASRGIGRAIALTLAEAGADVAVNYAGNAAAAEEVAAEIRKMGRRALILQGDVSQTEAAAAMLDAVVAEFGRCDILVNNAGITRDGLLMRMKEEDWDAVLNTNLKGVFNCIGFTKSVAKEVASRGITVNAVAPGLIATDMTSVLPDKVIEEMAAGIPLKRAGQPVDVAKAVLFLVSDDAAYITGQTLNVDGGMVM